MPKPRAARSRRPIQATRPITELRSAAEGEIAELCRDLAVQIKRMRELEKQAEELRLVIRELVGQPDPEEPVFTSKQRAGRRARTISNLPTHRDKDTPS